MGYCTLLPLALSLLALAALLRHWFLADQSLSLWFAGEDDGGFVLPAETLQALDEEIAQRRARLADLERTGGSGGWTARYAIACHRRRLNELHQRRQKLRDKAWRWRFPLFDPRAIREAPNTHRSRTGVQTKDDLLHQ
jgi:hypothetical protein